MSSGLLFEFMGMFDTVIFQGESHQTKDFDCEMETYWIEGGRLFSQPWHWEPPYPSEERKRIYDPKKDMEFHGVLNFYGKHDWLAKFTDGNLVELKDIESGEQFAFVDGKIVAKIPPPNPPPSLARERAGALIYP